MPIKVKSLKQIAKTLIFIQKFVDKPICCVPKNSNHTICKCLVNADKLNSVHNTAVTKLT